MRVSLGLCVGTAPLGRPPGDLESSGHTCVPVCLLPSDQSGSVGPGPMLHLVLLPIPGCWLPVLWASAGKGGGRGPGEGGALQWAGIPSHRGLQQAELLLGLGSECLWVWGGGGLSLRSGQRVCCCHGGCLGVWGDGGCCAGCWIWPECCWASRPGGWGTGLGGGEP